MEVVVARKTRNPFQSYLLQMMKMHDLVKENKNEAATCQTFIMLKNHDFTWGPNPYYLRLASLLALA